MVHKVDSEGAGPAGTWVEASPGVPKTVARAKFFNMVQAELLGPLEAADIEPDDADSTQLSDALDVLLGAQGPAALKSRIVNGALVLWQRGTSFAVGNLETYTADRWAARADQVGSGAGTATISRQAFVAGQTDVPGDPSFYLRWDQTIGATAGAPALVQKIEGVATFEGSNATVSFEVRADVPTPISVRLVQTFGSGGSADVVVATETIAVGSVWARATATFLPESLAGKTIGAGSTLRVEFLLPFASTFRIEFANLQFEPGDNATPFERRALQIEYELAARYFETSYPAGVTPGTADADRWTAPAQHVGSLESAGSPKQRLIGNGEAFRVKKRATPTIVWYPTAGTITPGRVTATAPSGGVGNVDVEYTTNTTDGFTGLPHAITVALNANPHRFAAHWTADAEL